MPDVRTGIVDISTKEIVRREAIATGFICLSSDSIQTVKSGKSKKGDVRESSTIAIIQAVKETPRLLPHCHQIPIEGCNVEWEFDDLKLHCTVSVVSNWTTGVEMEALCGVSAGLLCAWDMLKSIEKDSQGQYPSVSIGGLRVIKKEKSNP